MSVAAKTVTWFPNRKLQGLKAQITPRRSVTVALGRTKLRGRTWAVIFKGPRQTRELAICDDTMAALIAAVRRIEREEKAVKAGWVGTTLASWRAVLHKTGKA